MQLTKWPVCSACVLMALVDRAALYLAVHDNRCSKLNCTLNIKSWINRLQSSISRAFWYVCSVLYCSLCARVCCYNRYNHLSSVLRHLPEMFAKLNHCTAEAEAQNVHSQLIQEQTENRWELHPINSYFNFVMFGIKTKSLFVFNALFSNGMFSDYSIEKGVMFFILLVILGQRKKWGELSSRTAWWQIWISTSYFTWTWWSTLTLMTSGASHTSF